MRVLALGTQGLVVARRAHNDLNSAATIKPDCKERRGRGRRIIPSAANRFFRKERAIGMRVVGVDGCPGGWVAVAWDIERRTLTPTIHWNFVDLLAADQHAAKIGIDIPIGLAKGVPR